MTNRLITVKWNQESQPEQQAPVEFGLFLQSALLCFATMKKAVLFSCWVILLWLVPGSQAVAQFGFSRFTPERLWDMTRVGQPVVSPDGRWLVFTLSRYPSGARRPYVDLWLLATDGSEQPRQLTRNPGPDFDPSWSPDSGSILYASQREQSPAQIYLLDLHGGEPLPLTRFPTGAASPRWRKGTGSIVFEALTYPDLNDNLEALTVRYSKAQDSRLIAEATESRIIRRGPLAYSDQLVTHLFEQDLDSNEVVDLMPRFSGSGRITEFLWDLSSDGARIAFSTNSSAPPFAKINRDVYLLEIEKREIVNLTVLHRADDFSPVFSPSGSHILYGRRQTQDSLADFTELVSYTLRSQEHQVVTDAQLLSPQYWQFAPDGRQIYFQAESEGKRNTYRIGAGGGKARVLVAGGDTSHLKVGPGGALYYIYQSFFQPPVIRSSDANGRHPQQLTFFNKLLIDSTHFGSVREFGYPGTNADQVHGYLLLPPGFKDDRRWPLVIVLHGGPHAAWIDSFQMRWNLPLFSSPGYVVAALNVHGSTGFGAAFAKSVVGDPVEPAAQDVVTGLNFLAAYPFIDSSRIAIVGGSYGGYLTAWLLTQNNRFKTAVIHAGVFDLVSQYASDFPWGRQFTYGSLPWEDPMQLARWSPSYRADQIRTPVLLLHGEKDFRVPVAQSLLFHNVLTGRGVPSRIVLFPNEAHNITGRAQAQVWWQEVFDWLHRYL